MLSQENAMTRASPLSSVGPMLLVGLCFAMPSMAFACDGSPVVRMATSAAIKTFIHTQRRNVVTFVGYSGAGYETPDVMLAKAGQLLDTFQPTTTIINIGATAEGIGAVYPLAKEKGFTTMGIVSQLALDNKVALSPCVDYVFVVKDRTWGGRLPGSKTLAPTSAAMLANSSAIIGFGGGDIARDEMQAAKAAGKAVTFFAADMNHQLARDKALKKGLPAVTDFRGTADAAFESAKPAQ